MREFQKDQLASFLHHGYPTLNNPNHAAGESGNLGVQRMAMKPLRCILQFLASQYEQGKQYHTTNLNRSAISVTHTLMEGVVVGNIH